MTTTSPPPGSAPPFAPLSGTRVLEWCGEVAGPFAGKILAALGADVIKVEPPLRGDPSRQVGPFPDDRPDNEQSALFLYLNNGKRSITLDPTAGDGRRLLLRLIEEWADVFLQDRPPAEADRTGLDYAHLGTLKPELVMVSVTPFGQSGPQRDYRMYPAQTSHAGGAAYILPDGNHYEDEATLPPMQWPRFVSDYSAGTLTTGGTLAALHARRLTGRGQHVDVSRQQAQMHPMRYVIDAYPNDGVVRKRHNAPKPPGVVDRTTISGTYRCADGYVALWPTRPYMLDNLIAWLGSPAWSTEERWLDLEQRGQHAREFQRLIQAELARHTMDEIYHGLQQANVCVAPINTADRILRSEQLDSRAFFRTVDGPGGHALPYPVLPFKSSSAPDRAPAAAPRLGEHTEAVLGGLLGVPAATLLQLRALGVI